MPRERGQHGDSRVSRTATQMPYDRQLPYSAEAEAGVIGAILLNPMVCDEVISLVRPHEFFKDANRRLFQCLLAMHDEGKGIDLTLLTERLRQNGEMEQIGGEAYIAEMMTSVPVAAHATHYAKIVRDKAILRELIETSSKILVGAYESDKKPRDLIAEAEEEIFQISNERSSQNVRPMREIMGDLLFKIDNMTEEMDGLSTGFTKLDEILNGLRASELIILAARPSMGKTALATNIADYVAVETKQPVLFFSLEMEKKELALRMLCARGRVPGKRLRGNYLDDIERDRFLEAAAALAAAPLYIDDSSSHTVSEIAAAARRLKRKSGLAMIVIDYLTLIEPDNPTEPRQEQVAKTARRLKGLARELDIPVLCLAQVNRQAEQSKDNRPRLSNLRESGAIEQDADVVIFVHREEYYVRDEEAYDSDLKGKAEIIIAKQRNGATGTIELRWAAEYTRFMNKEEFVEIDGYNEFQASGSDDF
ncbi:MAG: replicative DNA helicase [Thermoguttaceae bacterium]|jgi:replicative DNA helicase